MGRRKHTDIEVCGVVYDTVEAAAEAHGVTAGTVYRAIAAQRLHRLGSGRAGREPMPIRIRGELFENAHVAASRHGVTVGAVYQALYRGEIDRVGLPRRRGEARAIPFAIAGLSFSSMAAASRALGFTSSYVSQALRRGTPSARERLIGAAMAYAARQKREAG